MKEESWEVVKSLIHGSGLSPQDQEDLWCALREEQSKAKAKSKKLAAMLMKETGPTVDQSIKGVVEQATRLLIHHKEQGSLLTEQNEELRSVAEGYLLMYHCDGDEIHTDLITPEHYAEFIKVFDKYH